MLPHSSNSNLLGSFSALSSKRKQLNRCLIIQKCLLPRPIQNKRHRHMREIGIFLFDLFSLLYQNVNTLKKMTLTYLFKHQKLYTSICFHFFFVLQFYFSLFLSLYLLEGGGGNKTIHFKIQIINFEPMYLSIPYKIMYLINLKRSKNFLREERSASIVNIY